MISEDPMERKAIPVATGVLDYFPQALCAVAECSRAGNDQHNPGKPLHWDRSKSQDESDALIRHFIERGTIDTDGIRHSAKVAWRALALLQKEIEADATEPVMGLKALIESTIESIEEAIRPQVHFSDKAEPGPVVPITLVTPLFKPAIDPPNQIEEPE